MKILLKALGIAFLVLISSCFVTFILPFMLLGGFLLSLFRPVTVIRTGNDTAGPFREESETEDGYKPTAAADDVIDVEAREIDRRQLPEDAPRRD